MSTFGNLVKKQTQKQKECLRMLRKVDSVYTSLSTDLQNGGFVQGLLPMLESIKINVKSNMNDPDQLPNGDTDIGMYAAKSGMEDSDGLEQYTEAIHNLSYSWREFLGLPQF